MKVCFVRFVAVFCNQPGCNSHLDRASTPSQSDGETDEDKVMGAGNDALKMDDENEYEEPGMEDSEESNAKAIEAIQEDLRLDQLAAATASGDGKAMSGTKFAKISRFLTMVMLVL